jgi:hypothetical protein
MFSVLPEELSSTFEKMISQLDIISKTMKIMDQRIATVENQVSEILHGPPLKKEQNSIHGSNQVSGHFRSSDGFTNNNINNNYFCDSIKTPVDKVSKILKNLFLNKNITQILLGLLLINFLELQYYKK